MDSDPTIDDIDRTGDDLIARIREITSHVKGHGNGWGPLLQACEREILRLKGIVEGEPKLIEFHYTSENGVEAAIEHWAVRRIAYDLWHTFEMSGAPNYLVMEIGGLSGKGPMEVTLRPKWGTKTSADVIRELRAEIANLKEVPSESQG